jgi:hypothetical protein
MVGRNAAKLTLPAAYARKHPVFHMSLLRPYKPGPDALEMLPLPDTVDEDGYFSVELVLGMRPVNKGRRKKKLREFLIKWVGYDDSHNSWEPEHNLTPDLIEAYDARSSAPGSCLWSICFLVSFWVAFLLNLVRGCKYCPAISAKSSPGLQILPPPVFTNPFLGGEECSSPSL